MNTSSTHHDHPHKPPETCPTCSCHGKESAVLPSTVLAFIEECLSKKHPDSFLIAVLHKAQETLGYLSQDTLLSIAYRMNIPAAQVCGVASFYNYFRLEAQGKFLISICAGTACYVKGAEALVTKFKEELGIEVGETTKDGLFSLEITRCLGACALAPVVKINDDIYPHVVPDQIPNLIKECIKKAHEKNSSLPK